MDVGMCCFRDLCRGVCSALGFWREARALAVCAAASDCSAARREWGSGFFKRQLPRWGVSAFRCLCTLGLLVSAHHAVLPGTSTRLHHSGACRALRRSQKLTCVSRTGLLHFLVLGSVGMSKPLGILGMSDCNRGLSPFRQAEQSGLSVGG